MKNLWLSFTLFFSSSALFGGVCGPGAQQTIFNTYTNKLDYVCVYGGGTAPFSIASFSDANSSTVQIGTGVWQSTGAISFSATYSNGTPIGSTVTFSGWGSGLALTNSFLGPTASVQNVNYPSIAGSVVFTLTAQSTTGSSTLSITHNFYNYRFWGTTTVASGYTAAEVQALAGSELSNSRAKSFTVNPGPGEYIIWSSPTRLGTVTFTVGGFEGGFTSPETVSITNSTGFTENYYVYRSVNSNLGSTTVTTQ